MDDPDVKLLLSIVVVAGLAGAFWLFRDDILPAANEPVLTQPEPIADEAPAEVGPAHPLLPLESSLSPDRTLVPLPPLDDSDSYFLLTLVDILGPEIEYLLANEALVDRFVATIDNLTRTHVAEKIRPVGRLPDAFVADNANSTGQFYLSPENFERYDLLVGLVTRADPNVINDAYRRFYPLFQKSYQRLGYPHAYFNDRVVEVIDELLATPEPDAPVLLVRPHVLYEFADAELEALSSGQKLLLRMGSEHAANIKQVLRTLRALIA